MPLRGILVSLPVSEATTATVVCGAGAHQRGTTDIVSPTVVVQDMFAEVVCWIIKTRGRRGHKDPKTKF